MHKPLLTPLLLACALALSACAGSGKAVKAPRPECPKPQPPPPSLMQTPSFEQQLRAELLEPEPSATPGSGDSRTR